MFGLRQQIALSRCKCAVSLISAEKESPVSKSHARPVLALPLPFLPFFFLDPADLPAFCCGNGGWAGWFGCAEPGFVFPFLSGNWVETLGGG